MMNIHNIHDNTVLSYIVDYDNKSIVLKTISQENKNIIVTFHDVKAHLFKNNTDSACILYDIEEADFEWFAKRYGDDFNFGHGFPAYTNSNDELKQYLIDHGYNIYLISSSLGFSGFVIAANTTCETID